jgi:hypothetical protein
MKTGANPLHRNGRATGAPVRYRVFHPSYTRDETSTPDYEDEEGRPATAPVAAA